MLRNFSLKNILLILINGLLLLAIIIINILLSSKSAVLVITTVPSDATVTIDGTKYQAGNYKFFPGEVTATIEKEGFDSKEVRLTLESNANNRLFVYLTKDGDLSYIKDGDISEFNTLRDISNISDDEYLKSFVKEYDDEQTLKDFLPIYYDNLDEAIFLTFSYETERCKEKPYCILITSLFDNDQNFAIKYLKNFGYSSSDYEILFTSRCKDGDLECAGF